MIRGYLCVVAVLVILIGCGDTVKNMESNFKIAVTGTEGLKYNGHYSFVTTGAVPKPENVKGSAPAEYKGKGVAAVCVIRKTTPEGTLKVEILKDDKVISTGETAAPYGIISLGKTPDKDSIINMILGKIFG